MSKLFEIKITCRDRPGIIAAVTGFLHHGLSANIVDLNHHTEEPAGRFFLLCRFSLAEERPSLIGELEANPGFLALARTFEWDCSVYDGSVKPRVAVLVTKADHCLYEILFKTRDGYLHAEICCVISNHDTLRPVAEAFGLPFHHFPATEDRREQEARVEEALNRHGAEAVALARYMQVLTPEFVERWERRVVNVHHGFLPAFKGARPYHQAWERGVKVIGATAHYATPDLDEGPILYQDVAPVRANAAVRDLIESGKDIERRVIVEGLKLHLERRVFLHEGRTILL